MTLKRWLLSCTLLAAITLAACTIPPWVNTIEADAKIAAPIAGTLISIIDPPLAPIVAAVEAGFNALIKSLDQYKTLPNATTLQAVEASFQTVNDNVAELENAAQIKNAATKTTITEVVQLLNQCVIEIAGQLPPATAAQMKMKLTVRRGSAKGWSPKDIKRQYNLIIKGDPRFQPLK